MSLPNSNVNNIKNDVDKIALARVEELNKLIKENEIKLEKAKQNQTIHKDKQTIPEFINENIYLFMFILLIIIIIIFGSIRYLNKKNYVDTNIIKRF
jgi:hypothetical protein